MTEAARTLTVCQGADLTRWQDGQRSSGRLWQRVKRRDRSLGPASAVRRVEVRQRSRRKPCEPRHMDLPDPRSARRATRTNTGHGARRRGRLRLAGLEVKPGSLAEACGYQTPRGSGIMPAMTESTAARAPTPTVKRDAKGKWLPGVSGHPAATRLVRVRR